MSCMMSEVLLSLILLNVINTHNLNCVFQHSDSDIVYFIYHLARQGSVKPRAKASFGI